MSMSMMVVCGNDPNIQFLHTEWVKRGASDFVEEINTSLDVPKPHIAKSEADGSEGPPMGHIRPHNH